MSRPARIFLGLAEIGGYYGNLRRGLEELGHDAVFVNLYPHPHGWSEQSDAAPQRVVRLAVWLARRDVATPRSRLVPKVFWRALSRAARLPLLVWACRTRDVFVFGFATTFFGYRELPLLRLLGKRIVYVFHGSDSRPSYIDGSDMAEDRCLTIEECAAWTRAKKELVRRIERHAHVIVANPLSAHLHETPCASFLAVGIPRHAEDVTAEAASPGPVRIVHSPSHPEAKGTPLLRAAVERLRARGHELELVELTGRPNREVLEELARCDIALDQLYSDTPMSGFAAEAASFGKPAVAGGYGIREMEKALAGEPFPPVALSHPDELEQQLEQLVVDRDLRRRIGADARRHVETTWSRCEVARRIVRLVEGSAPAAWWFEPRGIDYVHGCGISEAKVRSIVGRLVEQAGVAALMVSDKPELERRLLEFAAGGGDA